MEKLKFFDTKIKKIFFSSEYKIVKKNTKAGIRYFAITKTPSGFDSYRIVSKVFYDKNK